MRPRTTKVDLYVALAATVLGGVLLYLALRARWNPQDINPGIEGTLGAGVVGTVLALLHPFPYRRVMFFSAPVIAIEYWAIALAGGPAVGIVGLHLILVGFLGLGIALRDPRPDPEPEPAGTADERG